MLTTLLLAATAMATNTKTNSTKPSSTSHKSVTPSKSGKSSSSKSKKKKTSVKATSHGQHGIDQERTRQIQEALIRDHYMTGEPTGSWDQATKDALTRYQEENGWQTKSVPDSRALIKLGLGPDKTGLLNPDTAVMSSPHELGSQQGTLPGGSAQQ
jgi:peptidoglycan hydrolase-like protein with peptidoglycan-binding domain